jgi:hypothetical protein
MFARVSPLKYLEQFTRFKLKATRKTGGGLNFHRSNRAKEGDFRISISDSSLIYTASDIGRVVSWKGHSLRAFNLFFAHQVKAKVSAEHY